MSGEEDEGFLNRWSRRKQEAAKEAVDTNIETAAPGKQDSPADELPEVAEATEEEFDVSKLPPIESITAGTDIRAFLSKGVPAALTQAALRRAWSADPAIRDYIGLSEYSWDFNSPGIDGFGPLDPSLNVQEMLADVFGKVKQAAAETEALVEKMEPDVAQMRTANMSEPAKSVDLREEASEPESPASLDQPVSHPAYADATHGDKTAQSDAAPQRIASDDEPTVVPVRRHGSALPS